MKDAAEALAVGVRGALAFATGEVNDGSPTSAVDVQVEGQDGQLVMHAVVTVAVAKLNAKPKTVQR